MSESDFSQLRALGQDMGEVSPIAARNLRSTMEVSARNVKDDWREFASGMAHAPAYPAAITYDVTSVQAFGVTVLQAEVGPDKDRPQGALGNVLEFGTANNPPQEHGRMALEVNQRDFEQGAARALADAEREAGIDSSVGRSAAAVIRGGY